VDTWLPKAGAMKFLHEGCKRFEHFEHYPVRPAKRFEVSVVNQPSKFDHW